MTTATEQLTLESKPKSKLESATPLSEKAQSWCKKVASIAFKKAFNTKTYKDRYTKFIDSNAADSYKFHILPNSYANRSVSRTDGNGSFYLHPSFFDETGNLKKKLSRDKRNELKAAIYKEVVHQVVPKTGVEFYKAMVRCPWPGARVDGALGSTTPARTWLSNRKALKEQKKRKITEVPTGLKEEVEFYSLTDKKHVTVLADIFLANNSIKIARAEYNGKKLRKMVKGAAELKAKLGL